MFGKASTSVSQEGVSIISEEGSSSVFEEGTINCHEEELDLIMPIMPNLSTISLRRSKRNNQSRKLQEQRDPKV